MLQVFSTSKGLTKTVFNPAALKTAQRNSEDTLRKKQVEEQEGRGGGGGGGEGEVEGGGGGRGEAKVVDDEKGTWSTR
jgi:hypothetical protein